MMISHVADTIELLTFHRRLFFDELEFHSQMQRATCKVSCYTRGRYTRIVASSYLCAATAVPQRLMPRLPALG